MLTNTNVDSQIDKQTKKENKKHTVQVFMLHGRKTKEVAIGEIFYYLVRSCILSTIYNHYDKNNIIRNRNQFKFLPYLSYILQNLYHSTGKFRRQLTGDIFLIFPRKYALKFHANCLRQFAWNVKAYFLEKIRKIFQYVICWNFQALKWVFF